MKAPQRLYADHNATTPVRPVVAEMMAHVLGTVHGNPSSPHAEGRAALKLIEEARDKVAQALACRASDVIFTSGATEALATLLRPCIVPTTGARRIERLLISAVEHAAALQGHGFHPDAVETIGVDGQGLIDLAGLENRLVELAGADGFAPVMLCVQAANSETGVVQPLAEIARLALRFGAVFICDAVQVIGKQPFDLTTCPADAIAISAHKFGGPKGVGAIVLNGDTLTFPEPLLRGGGQEMRRRSGTQNVAGIAGMGEAITIAAAKAGAEAARLFPLRDGLEADLRALCPDAVVFGNAAARLPNTLAFAIPGTKAQTLLMALDLAGLAVSSGSACSSGKVARSHVLSAMGVAPDLAEGALRISLGWTTAAEDIPRMLSLFETVMATMSQKLKHAAA